MASQSFIIICVPSTLITATEHSLIPVRMSEVRKGSNLLGPKSKFVE